MRELSLVPTAVVVWAVSLVVVLTRTGWWAGTGLLAATLIAALLARRWWPEIAVAGGAGLGALIVSWVRIWRADNTHWPTPAHLKVHVDAVTAVGNRDGLWLITGDSIPFLFTGTPPTTGSTIAVTAAMKASDRPSVTGVIGTIRQWHLLAEPTGWARIAGAIHTRYLTAVEWVHHPGARGLIPGMVIGDTSLQTPDNTDLYTSVGLSHLSAVSGSNVAIVTTACALLVWWATPRLRIAVAIAALIGYVGIVGLEPSVLRAAVTGMVGFIAVLSARRAEPIHAVSLAVILLVLWDSDLAVSYGFALSVVATAGIVIVSPVFFVPLARTRLPAILVRALAVAIAADITTMPIVAMMTGQVSTVSVLANLCAAPAVAPVTVVGLLAVPLSFLPGHVERVALLGAEPFAWWIDTVAHAVAQFPLAQVTVPAGVLGWGWVAVVVGWVVWAVLRWGW
ncbi:MAG: ComEC/Rec2 family competence protein [Corynebacterium sp.]|nr:ComEC/Rec2 family competence protein [Corynebacterium sp.]